MKKLFTLLATLLIGLVATSFAQTIVGTDPENKNVVLEEFTGIHCGYCPDGHAIAQAIYNANPEDVVLLAIHTGGYASPGAGEPDFRTPFGAAIAGQTDLQGYPAGTVNRHLFPGWSQGSGTAMGRGQWTGAANQILATPSYLNIAAEASIIPATRQLSVLVEVYYTGDSPETTNLLNVAIAQNNISGPQSGGNAGNNYQHMHMLRHLVTGQWGIEIPETTEGSFYTTTLTYEIPADYNDVDVILEDLDIVAFVTETHQEVVSGIKASVTFPAASDYDAAVKEILFPISQACEGDLGARIELKNYGAINLTSADIEYTVNGGDIATYSWTGDLEYPDSEIVNLPAIPFDMLDENTIEITVNNPNGNEDENTANDMNSSDFAPAEETSLVVDLQLFVGHNGGDISWEFYNGSGELLAEGGDYVNNETVNMTLPIDGSDCYNFVLRDQVGDGFMGGGYLKLKDDGDVFVYITDELEDLIGITFHADIENAIDELDQNSFSVYPNPSYDMAYVAFNLAENAEVNLSLYNIIGKKVMALPTQKRMAGNNEMELSTSSLEDGVYFVHLEIDGQVITKKIAVAK